MSSKLASLNVLAIWVAGQLVKEGDELSINQCSHQVQSVMLEVGKFVSFMFRKTSFETVIADVINLG